MHRWRRYSCLGWEQLGEVYKITLYERFKRRIDRISDTIYFGVNKKIQRSSLVTRKNVIMVSVMVTVIFLISGGVVAITNPMLFRIFSRTTTSQSYGETLLFCLFNTMALLGLYLVEKGVKKRFEATTFLTGLTLFFTVLASIWFIVVFFKGM